MIRLIAAAGFVVALATSGQAITPAPLPQPDGMFTQVRFGCGPGRTRVAGVCVARTTIRHTRRAYRRGYSEEPRAQRGFLYRPLGTPPGGAGPSANDVCGLRRKLRQSSSAVAWTGPRPGAQHEKRE